MSDFIVVFSEDAVSFYVVNHERYIIEPAGFLDGMNFKNVNEMTLTAFEAYRLYLCSIGYNFFSEYIHWNQIIKKIHDNFAGFSEIMKVKEDFNKKATEYFSIKFLNDDLMEKIVKEEKISFDLPYKNLSQIEKNSIYANEILNKNPDSLSVSVVKRLKNNPKYKTWHENECKRVELFSKYAKSFFDCFEKKEKIRESIYSFEYYNALIEYAKQDIFISVDRTNWLPIECPNVTPNEILDYFLLKEISYLYSVYHDDDDGTLSYKVNRDLKVAMKELELKNYCSACRILCTLIDNNHKSLAEAFNGFASPKEDLKNGADRSTSICKLFNVLGYYKLQWNSLDLCIKKINNGSGFINRNDLIHGKNVKIDKYDCIKLLLIFIYLNNLKDQIGNISEISKCTDEIMSIFIAKESKYEK